MSDAEKFQAILERDPTDTQAFVNLCDIAEKDGDYEYLAELLKYRAQVTQDEQEVVDLHFRAGEVYLDKLNDMQRGAEVLLEGFDKDPTHAGIGDRLDGVYREAEDWEGALQLAESRLDFLAEADVNGTKVVIRSDLHQQAGEVLERAIGDDERALAHYRKAIELDKTNLLAIYGAREIYYRARSFKNAAKLCELEARVEKDNERKIALYRELAHILSTNLSDADQAVMALKRAHKLDQQNPEVKLDLARTIAATSTTDENKKDHRWASEFLMKAARGAETAEVFELARLALLATPASVKAMEFIESKAGETGDFEALAEVYKEIIEAAGDLETQAPMIRRLAKIYLQETGSPEEALNWIKKVEPLGFPEDAQFIDNLSRGVEVRASQMPQPVVVSEEEGQPQYATPFEEPDDGLFKEESDPLADAVAEVAENDFEVVEETSEYEELEVGRVSAPEVMPEGMSEEDFVESLQQQAERARRSGDDATAEERMMQVLDYVPQDQKATTYLERRFRARGDWGSLRDLLLRSAGAPHLPAAVQTVRLREAARLSEEQLGDLEGAIRSWRMIQENDPKVRDAVDALKRLLSETEKWDELLEVVENEAATTKSRAKRIEAFRRLAEIYHIRIGDVARAADAYKKVLDLAPEDAEAMEALDELYLREQQYEELIPLLDKRAEMTRDRAEKREFLLRSAVMLRERLGQNEEAYEKAREVLEVAPNDGETLELMESIDEEGEQWERLLDVLTMRARAVEEPEEKAVLLKKKAMICAHRLEDHKGAVRAWYEVLDALPGDEEALEALARGYEEKEEWEDLVSVLKLKLEIMEDVNDRAEQHRRIAHVLDDNLGRADEAMESWRLVLEAGEDVEGLGALSRYYERIEDWSELAEVLERQAPHAEDHAERASILFKRASILYEKQGEREEATAELKKILAEVDPAHIPTLDLLRTVLAEDNKYEKAVEALEQQIAHTEDPEQLKVLMVLLGDWSRSELKDLDRAIDAYERVVDMDGADEERQDVLDDVYVEAGEWDKLLKLLYGRYQRQEDDDLKLEMLQRGAKICEEDVEDNTKAWFWHRQAFDALRHLDPVIPSVEEAAHRMELWNEINDVYVVMTKTAQEVSEQVEWWMKIAIIFEEKLEDPGQGLEAVLRAFGLDPENVEMLDAVDRLAVAAENWQRLSTVYNALAGRAKTDEKKIEFYTRHVNTLNEKAEDPHKAFDVSLKAFEVDPTSEEILTMVEGLGEASERWDDLVRVYNVCTTRVEDSSRKADLKLRAALVLRDKIDDPDGAFVAVLEVLMFDPFSDEVVENVWGMVRQLEEALLTTEKGVYWAKLIEMYRKLVVDNRHERENQVDLLMIIAKIYAEELDDDSAAFECLKEAQQINPRDEGTIDKLEAMAGEQNFWESVVDHYADILDETFEMDVAVMYHKRRARILADELDQADEAAEHYWQIIQLDATDENAYGQLLAHYERNEKWNELVNLLERQMDATKDDDKRQEVLLQIAAVWEDKIKNKFEAKDWYEQVITIWPDNEKAKIGLERLMSGTDDVEDEEDDDDMQSLTSIPPPAHEEEEVDEEEVDEEDVDEEEVEEEDVDEEEVDEEEVDEEEVDEEEVEEEEVDEEEVEEEEVETISFMPTADETLDTEGGDLPELNIDEDSESTEIDDDDVMDADDLVVEEEEIDAEELEEDAIEEIDDSLLELEEEEE